MMDVPVMTIVEVLEISGNGFPCRIDFNRVNSGPWYSSVKDSVVKRFNQLDRIEPGVYFSTGSSRYEIIKIQTIE